MQMSQSPVQILSDCFGQAMWDLFSDIVFEDYYDSDDEDASEDDEDLGSISRRPDTRDIEVLSMFAQKWPSTYLGFSGIGKEEKTIAYTVVLGCSSTDEACVFFGGKFAYKVFKPNDLFSEDLSNREMKNVDDADVYGEKVFKH